MKWRHTLVAVQEIVNRWADLAPPETAATLREVVAEIDGIESAPSRRAIKRLSELFYAGLDRGMRAERERVLPEPVTSCGRCGTEYTGDSCPGPGYHP